MVNVDSLPPSPHWRLLGPPTRTRASWNNKNIDPTRTTLIQLGNIFAKKKMSFSYGGTGALFAKHVGKRNNTAALITPCWRTTTRVRPYRRFESSRTRRRQPFFYLKVQSIYHSRGLLDVWRGRQDAPRGASTAVLAIEILDRQLERLPRWDDVRRLLR